MVYVHRLWVKVADWAECGECAMMTRIVVLSIFSFRDKTYDKQMVGESVGVCNISFMCGSGKSYCLNVDSQINMHNNCHHETSYVKKDLFYQ